MIVGQRLWAMLAKDLSSTKAGCGMFSIFALVTAIGFSSCLFAQNAGQVGATDVIQRFPYLSINFSGISDADNLSPAIKLVCKLVCN